MPVGPTSRTRRGSRASTARGGLAAPVLRMRQLRPALSVRSSSPTASRAKPVAGRGNDTLTTASDVAAPRSSQLRPPLVVRASDPPRPYAYAVADEVAWRRSKVPATRPPTREKSAPPSSESTTVPSMPTATARDGVAGAAARRGSVAGTTALHVSPASADRRIWSPRAVVARQVRPAQWIELSSARTGTGRADHAPPPSVVPSSVHAAPTPYPVAPAV